MEPAAGPPTASGSVPTGRARLVWALVAAIATLALVAVAAIIITRPKDTPLTTSATGSIPGTTARTNPGGTRPPTTGTTPPTPTGTNVPAAPTTGGPATSPETPRPNGEPATADTIAPFGRPLTGGRLVYGLQSETDGLDVATNRLSAGGMIVAQTVFDPLAADDKAGNPKPYLLESFTPNADFTQWRLALRREIRFHNALPANSQSLADFFERLTKSPVSGSDLADITGVDAIDGVTVELTMAKPWPAFPQALTGQLGLFAQPDSLGNLDRSHQPIGTGPFIFDMWVAGQKLLVKKNPNYWRKDAQGVQLPYLDEVQFLPIPDSDSRVKALDAGDTDITVLPADASLPPGLQTVTGGGQVGTMIAANDQVRAFVGGYLPDGSASALLQNGSNRLTETWFDRSSKPHR